MQFTLQAPEVPTGQPIPWFYGFAVVPLTTPQAITTLAVKVNQLVVTNIGSTAAAITVTDNSTEVGGQPCQLVSALSVPSHATTVVHLGSAYCALGVSWFSDTANALHAQLQGTL